jgi:pimeloyl-ACP methyl ester carboxylesterase
MYLAHDFQRDLERDFVVVQWDRLGAGKSYPEAVSAPKLSVSQEINDTVELIDQLRARFHQEKIYLVGFSYGTYLGILIAQRVPERLHAYVGIGQLACSEDENRKIQDEWLVKQASNAQDREALDELTGKKPLDREKWLFKYGAELHSAHHWWPLLWSGIRSPDYTFRDIMNVKKGVQFTASHLRYDAINGSILDNVSTIRIPVYFFSGRFDYTDPTICTVRLLDNLAAPIKRMVWFEHSAHFVFFEEPEQFALAMKRVAGETSRWESEQRTH